MLIFQLNLYQKKKQFRKSVAMVLKTLDGLLLFIQGYMLSTNNTSSLLFPCNPKQSYIDSPCLRLLFFFTFIYTESRTHLKPLVYSNLAKG